MNFQNQSSFQYESVTEEKKNNIWKYFVGLNEKQFFLNKSKSKFVGVGISYNFGYKPYIKLSGLKSDSVFFTETEWLQFLEYQGIITNYFYTMDIQNPIKHGNITLSFEKVNTSFFIKVQKDLNYVSLAFDTVCTLWNTLPLIKYRIDIIKRQQFSEYINNLKLRLRNKTNLHREVMEIIRPEENLNSENISTVLEFITYYPDLFNLDNENSFF